MAEERPQDRDGDDACEPEPPDDKVEAARRLLREAIARPAAVPVTIRSRRDPPPQR